MATANWRISWHWRQARIWMAWHGAALRSRSAVPAGVLSPDAARPDSVYWRQHPRLLADFLSQAERIRAGEISLMSAGVTHYRKPPFWNTHPLTEIPLPKGFFPYEVESLPSGDPFLAVWKNCLQGLPLLAQGFQHTHDPAYLNQMCDWIDSWVEEHYPPVSMLWISGLDMAMRSIAIIYALSMLPPNALRDSSRRKMTRILLATGELLEEFTNRPSFNHLIVESFGLFCSGLAFRHTAAGARWIEKSSAILNRELFRQFFADGMHCERSPGYTRFVLEVYLHYRALGRRFGMEFSADLDRTLLRTCEALCRLSDGEGRLPNFCDDSDLNLFTGERTSSGCLAIAASLFGRADFKAYVKEFPPVAHWLLGDEGYAEFAALPQAPPLASPVALPDAGYYVMHSRAGALYLSAGEELTPAKGHSHADQLTLELRVGNDRPLVDPGCYLYYPERKWRDYFRSTAAHNTATVDGEDQAERRNRDHFGWSLFPKACVHRWITGGTFDFWDAEHNGYARLPQPVTHRRQVLHVKPDYWLLIDDFFGSGIHRCELFFQFAAGEVSLNTEAHAVAVRPWGHLEIWQLAESCEADLVRGQEEPIRGWVSSGYGHREPAPSLRFAMQGVLPLRFYTVVIPVLAGAASARRIPRHEPLAIDEGVLKVESENFCDEILVSGRPGSGVHILVTRRDGVLDISGEREGTVPEPTLPGPVPVAGSR